MSETKEILENEEPASSVTDVPEKSGLAELPSGLFVGKLSDVGQVREINEDSFYTFQSVLHHHRGAEPFGLFVVADGMGGHERGEEASVMATKIAAASILKDVYLPFLGNERDSVPINEALTNAVERANTAVIEKVPDGGTTLIMALVMGSNAYIAHVGDSRAYVFQKGILKSITEDHSLSQRLQQMGQSATEALQAQNVLYRAIGQGETVEVDTKIQHLPPGTSLLLCSDGLWGMVDDETIEKTLHAALEPQTGCEQLVDQANQNGGRDNITVILVSVGGSD